MHKPQHQRKRVTQRVGSAPPSPRYAARMSAPDAREWFSQRQAEQLFSARTAETHAAFLLRRLHPGMHVLECGCGPGTITVGLAAAIAPAMAIGIDLSGASFRIGQALAMQKHIPNVRFAIADLYNLPYPPAFFDVVFSRNVFQHLKVPMAAMKEIRRVLKPSGMVALLDDDWGSLIFSPSDPILEQSIALLRTHWKCRLGRPTFARRHRELLRKAGFESVEASASVEFYGTLQATRYWGRTLADLLMAEVVRLPALKESWATLSQLEAMAEAWKTWGEHPDAFWAMTACEAIAWNCP